MSDPKSSVTAQEVTLEAIERQRLLKPFSNGRPWDEAEIKIEIQALNQITNVAVYELGCRLIFAKNHVPEGRWLGFVEDCGLSRQTTAQYMRIARLTADKPRLRQLGAGVAKLDILVQADEEDLADFEQSGELRGVKEDELLTKSRKELKELVIDKEKRIQQAKQQVKALQEENEKLKGQSEQPREAFYADLHDFRRDTFARLDALQREALDSGDGRKTIALYNLVNQFKLNCVQRQAELEQNSSLGLLLQGTGHGWDAPYLMRTDLGEIAEEEAASICLEEETASV